jgi:type II secretory pathway component PulF
LDELLTGDGSNQILETNEEPVVPSTDSQTFNEINAHLANIEAIQKDHLDFVHTYSFVFAGVFIGLIATILLFRELAKRW